MAGIVVVLLTFNLFNQILFVAIDECYRSNLALEYLRYTEQRLTNIEFNNAKEIRRIVIQFITME